MWWGGRAHFSAVFLLKEGGDDVGGEFFAADVQEGSGDVTDHFVKEPGPFKFKTKTAGFLDQVEAGDCPDWVFGGATLGGFVRE